MDYAKIAEGMGAVGYQVTAIDQLEEVFAKAIEDTKNGKTVVIDAKILSERPFPTEYFMGNLPENFEEFAKKYEAEGLFNIREELKKVGMISNFEKYVN